MILDCVRAVHPPFSPESVVAEFAVDVEILWRRHGRGR